MHDHSIDLVARPAALHCGEPLQLLCDEMLRGLGRWLRAAGYDTAIAEDGTPDRDLLALARAEARVLLTCDRELAACASREVAVVALATESLDAGARELNERLGIDWLLAPFTRCLLDNALLEPSTPVQRRALPPKARVLAGPVNACPACHRLYWPGSHVRRMQARLSRWYSAPVGRT